MRDDDDDDRGAMLWESVSNVPLDERSAAQTQLAALMRELVARIRSADHWDWEKTVDNFTGQIRELGTIATNTKFAQLGLFCIQREERDELGPDGTTQRIQVISYQAFDPIFPLGHQQVIRSYIWQKNLLGGGQGPPGWSEVNNGWAAEAQRDAIRDLEKWIRWLDAELASGATRANNFAGAQNFVEAIADDSKPNGDKGPPKSSDGESEKQFCTVDELPNYLQRAWKALQFAQGEVGRQLTYRAAHAFLKDDGPEGYEPPAVGTFEDNCTKAAGMLNESRKSPSAGRTGRSIIRQSEK